MSTHLQSVVAKMLNKERDEVGLVIGTNLLLVAVKDSYPDHMVEIMMESVMERELHKAGMFTGMVRFI